ncbi:MAG: hypothetical protein AAB901_02295, partial [Patescibacteria group bacterium]
LNTQRLSVYAERSLALSGTDEEIDEQLHALLAGNTEAFAAYDAKRVQLTPEVFFPLLRRLVLQVTDAFWLEHLETMDYLRRSVSLRAYGQRDPLIEYRREGLARFNAMQAAIADAIASALPHLVPADDSRIRAEEERTRRALLAASEGGDGSQSTEPIKKGSTIGRNDEVTIRKGDETQTMKYKKAEPLLAEGWTIVN